MVIAAGRRATGFNSTAVIRSTAVRVFGDGRSGHFSHTPANAWPFVKTSSGCRPICSSAEQNNSARSMQVATPPSALCATLRIFCPATSKLAGGSA